MNDGGRALGLRRHGAKDKLCFSVVELEARIKAIILQLLPVRGDNGRSKKEGVLLRSVGDLCRRRLIVITRGENVWVPLWCFQDISVREQQLLALLPQQVAYNLD